jgi:hypothetical protein
MTNAKDVKRQIGADFICFIELPSYQMGRQRGIAVVRPTPAELMYKAVQERRNHENIIVDSDKGTMLSYELFSLDEVLNELIFGKNESIFLAFLDERALDVETVHEGFLPLLKLLFSHFNEIIESINNKNFVNTMVKKSDELKTAGDRLYLIYQGLGNSEDKEKALICYNKMMFLSKLLEYRLQGNGIDFKAQKYDEVDYGFLDKDTVRFNRNLEDFRDKFGVYMQKQWEEDVHEWVEALTVLALKTIVNAK